jgi:hypothetical protein
LIHAFISAIYSPASEGLHTYRRADEATQNYFQELGGAGKKKERESFFALMVGNVIITQAKYFRLSPVRGVNNTPPSKCRKFERGNQTNQRKKRKKTKNKQKLNSLLLFFQRGEKKNVE